MTHPRRALVVIDVQNDYFAGPLEIQYPPLPTTLSRITDAMDAARDADIPVMIVQHVYPAGAPVFAEGSVGVRLHPDVEQHAQSASTHVTKNVASVFAADGAVDWFREHNIDTVTLVGFMTNNCVLGTAAAAEPLGFAVEVLSDAAGAINIANEAGSASAQQVHETLLAVLHSNWAAVSDTAAWQQAIVSGTALPKSDLGTSAVQGRALHE